MGQFKDTIIYQGRISRADFPEFVGIGFGLLIKFLVMFYLGKYAKKFFYVYTEVRSLKFFT